MVKLTLTLSAVYLAAVGVGLMFFPLHFGVGAVPADASPELRALLRLLGGPFLGIAILNWLSRNADPRTLRSVLVANIVGFGVVAANDMVGVATRARSRRSFSSFIWFSRSPSSSRRRSAGAQETKRRPTAK